jgi:HAD superfamily hydrolase (TIGR01549 family)
VAVSQYDAIVYDLDGTLVRLDVDWEAVHGRVAAVLEARGVDPGDRDIWELRRVADEHNALDRVDEVIAEFEREGAMSAARLAPADLLPHDVPVGVVSLNAEAACRIALELYGLDRRVGTVVGRDSVETVKPDPEPLLAALDELGVAPGRAVFVGDSASDRETAERAGTAFAWAGDWA